MDENGQAPPRLSAKQMDEFCRQAGVELAATTHLVLVDDGHVYARDGDGWTLLDYQPPVALVAEQLFLDACVASHREEDRLRKAGESPDFTQLSGLREEERRAWDAYREFLDSA